jgi:hypothetical protein
MGDTTKIPKEAVLYIHKKDTNYKCKDCVFARDMANKCAIYGSTVQIKPYGACGLWVKKKGNIEVPFIGTANKEVTGYVENQPGFTCGRCEEFLPDAEDCKKVDRDSLGDDPGAIKSTACCNRWEKLKDGND